MTVSTKSDEGVHRVTSQVTARNEVMNLKVLRASTTLAMPTVPLFGLKWRNPVSSAPDCRRGGLYVFLDILPLNGKIGQLDARIGVYAERDFFQTKGGSSTLATRLR